MRKTLEILALSALLLFPFNKGTNVIAEDIKPKQAIELTVNYGTQSKQKPVDSSASKSAIYLDSNGVYLDSIRDANVPELTLNEENQVKDIISDIQNQNINSYQDLITASQNLSESQKLLLSSITSHLLYGFNYDIDLLHSEIGSQDDFFDSLQDSLVSGDQNSLGTCGHIATHVERFLNNLGIKSAAVSGFSENGIRHVYGVSKIENKTAIVDSYNILIIDTKNIKKSLQAYQKHIGTTALEHLFFEDTEFQYRLLTNDGENFLDFIEYDESSNPLKNSLIQDFKPETYFKTNISLEDFLTSAEFNLFGLFLKTGEIRGNSNSALEKLTLSQIGFKRGLLTPYINNKLLNFVIGNKIIDINGNIVSGNLFQDTKLVNNKVQGIMWDLIFATNNEKGFNFSFRHNYTHPKIKPETNEHSLFYDYGAGAGISYKLSVKNTNIQPYSVSQFNLFKKNIDIQEIGLYFSELVAGSVFDIKIPNKFSFSIEPYYIKRIWEQGFGGKAELGIKGVGINAEGQITKSDYEFCPDKYNFSIGPSLRLGNLKVEANYQREGTNYDGEKEHKESLNINGSLNF